jgi:mRNA interferase MazF
MANPAVKRGDVILVLFPHSNLKTARPRPALVVQADRIQTDLPQVIVAMITSRMFRHP